MIKYAQIINDETKECAVGEGTDTEYYQSIGMTEMDVEQDCFGGWFLKGYVPEPPVPTKEEQSQKREEAYTKEVDPITCHINRLKDKEQTPEVIAEIEELKQERDENVDEIKQRYPYPEE